MTQKEKIKKVFLENPEKLHLSKIENFLLSEWFELFNWKWSHKKIVKGDIFYVYPEHNNDILNVYKIRLSKIYKKFFNN